MTKHPSECPNNVFSLPGDVTCPTQPNVYTFITEGWAIHEERIRFAEMVLDKLGAPYRRCSPELHERAGAAGQGTEWAVVTQWDLIDTLSKESP